MTGKRQFGARREDPHPCRVLGFLRRQYESCLGQVELGCDRLHLLRGQLGSIGHDGEGIAAELPICEHIERDEFHLHGALAFRRYTLTHAPISPRGSTLPCCVVQHSKVGLPMSESGRGGHVARRPRFGQRRVQDHRKTREVASVATSRPELALSRAGRSSLKAREAYRPAICSTFDWTSSRTKASRLNDGGPSSFFPVHE